MNNRLVSLEISLERMRSNPGVQRLFFLSFLSLSESAVRRDTSLTYM